MEKKEFLECKKEIVAILEKYGADYKDAPRVIVSALNEIMSPRGLLANVILYDLPDYRGDDYKN